MNDDIKDLILSAFEVSLEAQLRAIRRLRQGQTEESQPLSQKGRSQVDIAYDILKKARTPLHVSEMIDRIQAQFGVAVDRESLVSSLSKKVPVRTASCVQKRTLSRSGPKPDEAADCVSLHRRRLAQRVSPAAHLSARGATSTRFADLLGPALSLTDHLDQWGATP